MPKYLFKVRYSSEGIEGVMREGGSARLQAARDAAAALGGSVESMHFAFGEYDAYAIAELPDNKAAAQLAMTVSASGKTLLTTVALLTVEDVDAVAGASKLDYSPPGGQS